MISTVPVTISSSATSTDATIQPVPVTSFDQAIFAFLQNPAIVDQMFWSGYQVGAMPRDMISGVVTTLPTGGSAPVLTASDSVLIAKWPDGNSYNDPSLDFGINAKSAHLGVQVYPASGSGSFYCVFVPDSTSASGLVMTQTGGTLAATVELNTSGVSLWWVYGTAGARITVPRTQINETGPNLIFACWDYGVSGAGQVALYVNSKTPVISSRAAAGTYHLTTSGLVFFDNSADNDPCEVRVSRHGVFNVSAHHDPQSQTKLLAAIQAFSDTYGVTLK